MIKAFVTDMDGTLFEGHGETVFDLSKRNEEALERIKKSDIEFCVASGRMIGFGIRVLEKYGFDKIKAAGFNGAVCYDQGEFVATRPLDSLFIEKIYKMMNDRFPNYSVIQVQGLNSERIFTDVNHPIAQKYKRDCEKIKIGKVMDFTVQDFLRDNRGTMAGKLSITLPTHEECQQVMKAIKEMVEDHCFVTRSNPTLIEIGNNSASKGVFVQYLKEAYHLNKDEIAVIGDALNDAEMFPESDFTFAMESGSEEVKKMARVVVKDVAEAIDWCIEYNQKNATSDAQV